MKLGIMQPYIFPYIGYFQLINAVDKFVVYDDVFFIKQGWINRNRIIVSDKEHLFTIPVKDLSSYKLIKETKVDNNGKWNKKFFKTLEQSYKKAAYFKETFGVIKNVFDKNRLFIKELSFQSIKQICAYLGINTEFVESSDIYKNAYLTGQERILDICNKENAQQYINPIGGMGLYSKDVFFENGSILKFLKTKNIVYKQLGDEFFPNLSIIDVMMFNSVDKIRKLLNEYELV
jgi:hypothetical protein